jgi:hypothetical protein
METRQEDDEALDTEVKDALTGLEGLAIRVSGIGSYILGGFLEQAEDNSIATGASLLQAATHKTYAD